MFEEVINPTNSSNVMLANRFVILFSVTGSFCVLLTLILLGEFNDATYKDDSAFDFIFVILFTLLIVILPIAAIVSIPVFFFFLFTLVFMDKRSAKFISLFHKVSIFSGALAAISIVWISLDYCPNILANPLSHWFIYVVPIGSLILVLSIMLISCHIRDRCTGA